MRCIEIAGQGKTPHSVRQVPGINSQGYDPIEGFQVALVGMMQMDG
jgi:hypothetical protein